VILSPLVIFSPLLFLCSVGRILLRIPPDGTHLPRLGANVGLHNIISRKETKQRQVTTMPNNKKSSPENHQREQLSRILHSRSRPTCTAASSTTGTELLSNHQGQSSEDESRRLRIISTLTKALELSEDVMNDAWDERNN
jgi:hypothetical protein